MSRLFIRRATPADADTITAFNLAIAQETEGRRLNRDLVGRAVARVLADASLGVYWLALELPPAGQAVAAEGGKVVGQLLVTYEFSDWRDGVFWWIQSVYVDPAARRTGVYRALHRHVEEQARATGNVCGLRLYTDRDNAVAQEVYRQLGMARSGYLIYEVDWSRERPRQPT
jgi:GNAT superfamily N-acetyltransferase